MPSPSSHPPQDGIDTLFLDAVDLHHVLTDAGKTMVCQYNNAHATLPGEISSQYQITMILLLETISAMQDTISLITPLVSTPLANHAPRPLHPHQAEKDPPEPMATTTERRPPTTPPEA